MNKQQVTAAMIDESFITVDSITSLDLDDGFAIKKVDTGWELDTFIACPSLTVSVGTKEYSMAEERVATVYKGKSASEPMLDRNLSENELSLLPNKTCDVLKLTIRVTNSGEATLENITVTNATNIGKLSHESIVPSLSANSQIDRWINDAIDCSKALFNRRLRENSRLEFIDIDNGIYLNEDGEPIVVPARQVHGQILVQEFMILANKLLTLHCIDKNLPIIFRNHKSVEVEQFKSSHPAIYEYYVKELNDTSQLNKVAGKAYYSMSNKGHLGLDLTAYATFTSPLRRFVDLANHTVLLSALGKPIKAESFTETRCEILNNLLASRVEVDEDLLKMINAKKTGDSLLAGSQVTTNQLCQIFKRTHSYKYREAAIVALLKSESHSGSSRPWGEIIVNPLPHKTSKTNASKLYEHLAKNEGLALMVFNYLVTTNALPEQDTSNIKKVIVVLNLLQKAVGLEETPELDMEKELGSKTPAINFKNKLLEICQKHGWKSPVFTSENQGLPHLPVWQVNGGMEVNGERYSAQSRSNNKKEAEQQICSQLVELISSQIPQQKTKALVLTGDAKSSLNLLSQEHQVPQPIYETTLQQDNPPRFVAVCKFELEKVKYAQTSGLSANKKVAQQAAASMVLAQITA